MKNNIRLCQHCNNVTSHKLIASESVDKVIRISYTDNKKSTTSQPLLYYFYKCGTCGDCSLIGGYKKDIIELPLADIPLLFPDTNLLENCVPQKIRHIYEEASQIKNKAPNAFVGEIRRAIEFLCLDKKARGGNLASKINSLIEIGIIPSSLGEMTTIIRLLGNKAVHANEEEITAYNVNIVDDFFRSIIEYVYVAPEKTRNTKLLLHFEQKGEALLREIEDVLIDVDPTPWMDTDDENPPYTYTDEAFEIVKKLICDNPTKDELRKFINDEFGFIDYYVEDVINSIWSLWEQVSKTAFGKS